MSAVCQERSGASSPYAKWEEPILAVGVVGTRPRIGDICIVAVMVSTQGANTG